MSQNNYSNELENSQDTDTESPVFKRAEVILIDDEFEQSENGEQPRFSNDEEPTPHSEQGQSTLSLRYTCLLGLVFCAIFGFGMLLLSLLMTILSAGTLFQNKELNATARRFWSLVGNTAVAGFGFTLGLISPRLGLSLVLLYFSMADTQTIDGDILSKIFRQSTSGFN